MVIYQTEFKLTIGRAARKHRKHVAATSRGRRYLFAYQYSGLKSTSIVIQPSTEQYLEDYINFILNI